MAGRQGGDEMKKGDTSGKARVGIVRLKRNACEVLK